jgi:hypothetical protein
MVFINSEGKFNDNSYLIDGKFDVFSIQLDFHSFYIFLRKVF